MIYLIGGKLHQWETGRMLTFTGAPAGANAIQFANQGDTVALEIEHDFTMENGDPNIRIPDKCLQSGKNLLVYLVETVSSVGSDDHSSHILETKVFPVAAKPRPKTYIPIAAEEALGVVRRLTAAAQEAAQEAEEARIKAEAEKLYAIDAADEAKTARAAAVTAKNEAIDAKNRAITAEQNAAQSEDNANNDAFMASNEAARAEIYADNAHSDSLSAASSVTKAQSAETAALNNALRAETAYSNSQKSSEYAKDAAEQAKSFATTARTEATSASEFADSAYQYSKDAKKSANDAASAASTAATTAAKNAAAETMQQIADAVGGDINNIAKINDETIGPDAWSSMNIVERLCPTVTETGELVQITSIEGMPLSVTGVFEGYLVISACGKNLYDAEKYPLVANTIVRYGNGTAGTSNAFYGTLEYIPVTHLRGKQIAIKHSPFSTNGSTGAGLAFYDFNKEYIANGSTRETVTTVPSNACYMRFSINKDYAHEAQIEIGNAVTDYEPGVITAVGVAETSELPAVIEARKGVNTIWAIDDGNTDLPINITVTGKADIAALLEKLSNAILAMGNNI